MRASSTHARASVRKLRYEELEATLGPSHFPAVFRGAGAPTLRAIWRATATPHERASEVDWDTFGRYALALGLTVGIDRGGYAHTVRVPVSWDPGEQARLRAYEEGELGALENAQALAFIARREQRERDEEAATWPEEEGWGDRKRARVE